MIKQKTTLLSGVIIEKDKSISLEEMASAVYLNRQTIIEMVEYHLLEPEGDAPENWRFDSLCLRRAKIAANFYKDLEINLSGIALALDLLDEIEHLNIRVKALEKLLE